MKTLQHRKKILQYAKTPRELGVGQREQVNKTSVTVRNLSSLKIPPLRDAQTSVLERVI